MAFKLRQVEKDEIIKYLKDKKYKPAISANLFKKRSRFKLDASGSLLYYDKIMIANEEILKFLMDQYEHFSFGRDTLKIKYEGISQSDVTNFLKNSNTAQLHKIPRKERIHTPIITNYPLERIQIDIIDLNALKGYNKQHRFVLTIIDHFSKYAWAYSMTQKSANKVFLAISDLIREKLKPLDKQLHILQSDNGGEFVNEKFNRLMRIHNITHITSSPYAPRSQGAIERFNKTLKEMLFKPDSNKVIKETKENIIEKADKMMEGNDKNVVKLKRGDHVRISLLTEAKVRKQKFQKKYIQNWSELIYKVVSVGRKSGKYGLADIRNDVKLARQYYGDQLMKIDYASYDLQEDLKKTKVDLGVVDGMKVSIKLRKR
jgi:transposase InsO family protein